MYKIAFLDDEMFDRLPAKNIGTKVGVAYPEYGEAYVRKSGSQLIDTFTMAHELEHLEGKSLDEHYDSENKCYYKGFQDILLPALGMAIGGPLLGGGLMGTEIGGAVGTGIGQSRQQNKNQQSAMQQGVMNQFQSPSQSQYMQSQGAPNVVQSSGVGSGGMTYLPSSGVRGLSGEIADRNLPRDLFSQQYGNYAGLEPFHGFRGGSF